MSSAIDPSAPASATRIVLIAGRVRHDDRRGHHDYLGGCRLLSGLLSRRAGVTPVIIEQGWPADESALDGAASIVIYDGGGGKQGCLQTQARIDAIERAVARGSGLVMLHQCVGFPRDRVELGRRWLGGVYAPGTSTRGHWKTSHDSFPAHEVTRGVGPWKLEDGWLTGIVFADAMRGVTPLVWAGAEGSAPRDNAHAASWACERPEGGRSFAYTGLDGHAAWSHEGLRRLVTNGVLWSAGLAIAEGGSDVAIDTAALEGFVTPRASGTERALAILRKGLNRTLGGKKRW